ncbi:MAG: sugar transferase [Anaerolineae bacterium]|nr:sugar transferase [Anaerolineae bacterium]
MTELVTKARCWGTSSVSGLPLRLNERRVILFLGDLLALIASGLVALGVWAGLAPGLSFDGALVARAAPWLAGLIAGWLALWAANGGYDPRLAAQRRPTRLRLATTALAFGVIYLALFFVLSIPLQALPLTPGALWRVQPLRLLPALFVVLAFLTGLAWRTAYSRLLTGARFRRRVLIIGAGQSGRTIARVLRQHGDGVYEIVGFVDDDRSKLRRTVPVGGRVTPRERAELQVLGDRHALKDLIRQHCVSTLVLAITHELNGELLPLLLDCLELGVEIAPMAVLYEELTGRVPVEHVGGSWYVAMPIQPPAAGSLFPVVRRLWDIGLAGLGLTLLGLALPVIALAIYLDSPGPIFYTQERVGKGGRIFRAYKFRSMVPDAERVGPAWAQENDGRVTRVGAILRKAHIDEFPQFLNILKGDMSAVGPRPERPEFVEELAREIPFYRIRHAVKPGMAGWALVHQGYAASKEEALLKLQYDLYYIKHQSLWLDLVILMRTIVDTVTLKGR